VFVALKSYFDGSQTGGRSMTLAAVSADESVWSELEPAWDEVLKRNGARYSHMKEAVSLTGAFEGWTAPQRDWFFEELLRVLQGYRDSPRIRRFSCSVDLVAHRRYAAIRRHPLPERLCARIMFPNIIDWYASFPDRFLDVLDLWFDENEPFMTHIREDWENRHFRRKHPMWMLIRTIAPADMRLTIPLQIADLMAWSRNRIEVRDPDRFEPMLAVAFRATNGTLLGTHREVGHKAMAESTFAEEGLRRQRLFDAARRRH
jgi:hypothetical protein